MMNAKPRSRREFLKVAAGTVGVGALAAHGQLGGLQLGSGTADAATTAVRVPKIEPEGVLWGLQYDPHVAAYKRLADLFKKQTGSTMNVQPQAWPLDTKLIAALSAGTQPDVCCIFGSASTALFIQNVLVPLGDPVFKAKNVDPSQAFIGDAVQAFIWKGQILGVPVESNAVGSVVNVPIEDVNARGLGQKYPPLDGQTYFESYPAMWQLAQALQVKRNGRVRRWGLTSQGWDQASLFGIMRSLGTDWWDLNARKFNVNTPAGVHAIQLLVETPVKMGIETELGGGTQSSVDLALAGKVALARGNPTVATTSTAKLGYHYELAGVPRLKPGQDPLLVGEGGWGFATPKRAKHPGAATAFLQMMATEQGQLAYAQIYDGLPFFAWKALADDTTRFADRSPTGPNRKAAALFAKLTPRTVYFGEQCGYYSMIAAAVQDACTAVRQGKLTSAAAAQRIQSRLEAQYKQYLKDIQKA